MLKQNKWAPAKERGNKNKQWEEEGVKAQGCEGQRSARAEQDCRAEGLCRTLLYLRTISAEPPWAVHELSVQLPLPVAGSRPPSPHRHRVPAAETLLASPVICRVTPVAENVFTLAESRLAGYILVIQRPTKSVTSVTGKNTSKCLELEHRRWLLTVLRSRKTLSTGFIWAIKVMSCLSKRDATWIMSRSVETYLKQLHTH